ncbi:premnaspirodiene oxygenase [Spatholobus suberectus]|nr:premnaspirodiene oxygenase [Spatholobus suberectus]
MSLQLGQTPTLVVSSVDVANEIYKTHDVTFANKPQTTAMKIIMYGCMGMALHLTTKSGDRKGRYVFLSF